MAQDPRRARPHLTHLSSPRDREPALAEVSDNLIAEVAGASWTVECQTGCFLTTNGYLISAVSGCCANQPNQNARCAGTRGRTSLGSRSDRKWPSSTSHTCPSASTT